MTSTGSVQDRIQMYINLHPDFQGRPLSEISAELISAGVLTAEELSTLDATSTFTIIASENASADAVDSFEHIEDEDEEPVVFEGERSVRKTNPKTGEVTIETITYFDGKPSKKRVTTETGELIAEYSYSPVKLSNGKTAVAIVAIGNDMDKIEQTVVSDIDDNGDYVDDAFIARTSVIIKDTTLPSGVDAAAGSRQVLSLQNGNLVEVVSDKGSKNIVYTEYNGDSISEYDAQTLNRQFQQTLNDGVQHNVKYDGEGNTYAVIKAGDGFERVRTYFNREVQRHGLDESYRVGANDLSRLNPNFKSDALQAGQYILVPGEYDANSSVLLNRGTPRQALATISNFMEKQAREKVYSSTIGEQTLSRNYNSYEELARENLRTQGISNPTAAQLNDRANELMLLNDSAPLKNGAKIKIITNQSSTADVSALVSAGFKQNYENNPFYSKFNVLDSNQKQQVLGVLKQYSHIKDLSQLKAIIFETTGVNLYDTSLTVNENKQGSMEASFYNSAIPLEYFITHRLGLDLKSETGKEVYNRMCQLPQAQLNNISASQFAPTSTNTYGMPNNKISVGSDAALKTVISAMANQGVELRTSSEIRAEHSSPAYKARRQKEEAITLLYNSVRSAYDIINSHLDELKSHMFKNIGTIVLEDIKHYAVPQALKDLINLSGIKNGTVDGLLKSVFNKKDELEQMLIKIGQLRSSSNFERDYKAITGHDYDPNAVQELMDLRSDFAGTQSSILSLPHKRTEAEIQDFQEKSNNLIARILGNDEAEDAQDFITSSSFVGNTVEMAAMIYLTAGMGELGFIKNVGAATEALTGSKILGTGIKSAALLGTYTAGRESLNVIDDIRNADSWSGFGNALLDRGGQVLEHSTQSALFGFVGGASAQKLFNLSKGAQNFVTTQFSKVFGKGGVVMSDGAAATGAQVFTPSVEAISAADKVLANGAALSSSEFVSKVAASTQGLNWFGKATNFFLEVSTFAGLEITEQAAAGFVKEIFTSESELKQAIADGTLDEYLSEKIKNAPQDIWAHFKEQGINLIMLKAVSFAIGAHSGNTLKGQYETLDNSKIYKTVIDGQPKVIVETANGKMVCNSTSDALSFLHQSITLEAMLKASPEKSETAPVDVEYTEVPSEYADLPVYARANLPENTIVMPGENLVISTVTGKPVGRLAIKQVNLPEYMRTGVTEEQAEILRRNGVSVEAATEFLNEGVMRAAPAVEPVARSVVEEPGFRPTPAPAKVPTPREVFKMDTVLTDTELSLTSSDLVLETGGKKVLTPEAESIVMRAAQQIHDIAVKQESAIVDLMRSMGLADGADFTYRSKGVQSLHDKIQNALFDNEGISLEKAIADVKDAEGVRTIYKTEDYFNHPEVRELLENGDKDGAVLRASELQSNDTFEALKRYVDSVADGTNEVEITRISNYMGKDGIPYFSEAQLSALKVYANSKGVKLPIVERVTVTEEADGARTETINPKSTTKIRGSGYTALQMNFRTKDGFIYEGQFRGGKVNIFAEAEHVPYDIRTGKDIVGTHTELANIYRPMLELLKGENKISDEMFDEHTAYLTAHYKYLRLTELGFEDGTNPPKFPRGLDARLRAENLELLHEYVEKIKKNPEREPELRAEYESKLVQNTPENTTSIRYNKVEPAVELKAEPEPAVETKAEPITIEDVKQELLSQTNPDGTARFNDKKLKYVLRVMRDDVQLGREILNMKNPDGSYRFEPFELDGILSFIKTDKDIVMTLLNMKNSDGSYRMLSGLLPEVYDAIKNDIESGMDLLNMKNPDGTNRVELYNFQSLMQLKSENPELFDYVIKMENPDGTYRFSSTSIEPMIEFLKDDVDLGKSILELRCPDNSYMFKDFQTGFAKNIIQDFDDRNFAISLLKMHDRAGNQRFDISYLGNISFYQKTLPENFNKFLELSQAQTPEGEYKYSRDMVFSLYAEYGLVNGDFEGLKTRYDAISDYMRANNLAIEYNVSEEYDVKTGLFNSIVKYTSNNVSGKIVFDAENKVVAKRITENNEQGAEEVLDINGRFSETGVIYDSSVRDFKKMLGSVKEVRDKEGNLLYTEKYVESESVPDKYNIVRAGADGREYTIGLAEYSESGNLLIEKNIVGADNTQMNYFYAESPNGGRLSVTKITDKEGNVILENRQTFKVLDNNHFQSVENGVSYDIQFTGNKIIVTRGDGETVDLPIENKESSIYIHENIVSLLRKLPGSALFNMSKFSLGEIGVGIHDVSSGNAHFSNEGNHISISHERSENNEVFILLHELGHMIDYKSANRIAENKELLEIFSAERQEFMENQSSMEAEAISYLTTASCRHGGIEEMIAETNAFLFANNKWGEIELRGQYLQQYFPKTFAKIAELLQTAAPKQQPLSNSPLDIAGIKPVIDEYTDRLNQIDAPEYPEVTNFHTVEEMTKLLSEGDVFNDNAKLDEVLAEWKSDIDKMKSVRTGDEHKAVNRLLRDKYSLIETTLSDMMSSSDPVIAEKGMNLFMEKVMPLSEYYQNVASVIDNIPVIRDSYFEMNAAPVVNNVIGIPELSTSQISEAEFRQSLSNMLSKSDNSPAYSDIEIAKLSNIFKKNSRLAQNLAVEALDIPDAKIRKDFLNKTSMILAEGKAPGGMKLSPGIQFGNYKMVARSILSLSAKERDIYNNIGLDTDAILANMVKNMYKVDISAYTPEFKKEFFNFLDKKFSVDNVDFLQAAVESSLDEALISEFIKSDVSIQQNIIRDFENDFDRIGDSVVPNQDLAKFSEAEITQIVNTLALMSKYNPENYHRLISSDGYKAIKSGEISLSVLKNLKAMDTIGDNYFYEYFEAQEVNFDERVSKEPRLSSIDRNLLFNIVDIDTTRQDAILDAIVNAKDYDVLKSVIERHVKNRLSKNKSARLANEEKGLFTSPTQARDEDYKILDLIEQVSENPDLAKRALKFTASVESLSSLISKMKESKLTPDVMNQVLDLFNTSQSNFKNVKNASYVSAGLKFMEKFNDIDLLKQFLSVQQNQPFAKIFDNVNENNIDMFKFMLSSGKPITMQDISLLVVLKKYSNADDSISISDVMNARKDVLSNVSEQIVTSLSNAKAEYIAAIKEVEASGEPQEVILEKKQKLYNNFESQIRNIENLLYRETNNRAGLIEIKLKDPVKYQRIVDSGLIEMVDSGKLDSSILKQLNINSDLSPEIYADLQAVKNGDSIVKEFREGTSEAYAFSRTKVGDVIEIGNKIYLNEGNGLTEWNMTKEKYLELFPPVLRFATKQRSLGNCYFVSSLASSMQNPFARLDIYKSIELQGNDVVVTIKDYAEYGGANRFSDGNIELDTKSKHIYGAKGLQMYEQTYAKMALREESLDPTPTLSEDTTPHVLMNRLCSGFVDVSMSEIHGLKNYGENENIPADFDKGVISINKINSSKLENLLNSYFSKPNAVLGFGTKAKPNAKAESTILPEYNLVSGHAYFIAGFDPVTNMVLINNPHSSMVNTMIPLDLLAKHMSHLYIAQL